MSVAIRRIRPDEYKAALELWNIVFPEDAHGYSAYYFEKRTKPEYILAAFDGNRMVADLHAIPYPLRFGKAVKNCAMVAGVATLPEYRHRGIAGALIRTVHAELRGSGVAAAVLKPDVDFYAQFGYLPFAYHNEYELFGKSAAAVEKTGLTWPVPADMLVIYNAFAAGFAGMMNRTLHDMELYLEEAELSGFAVTDGQSYALCTEKEQGIEISELVGRNPLPLAASLAGRYQQVRFRLPASMRVRGLEPVGRMMFSMICPLDEKELLSGIGAENTENAGNIEALLAGAIGSCCTLEFC